MIAYGAAACRRMAQQRPQRAAAWRSMALRGAGWRSVPLRGRYVAAGSAVARHALAAYPQPMDSLTPVEDSPLRKARLRLGLTQTEMAEQINVNVSSVSRIERGTLWPDRATMTALLMFLQRKGVRMTVDEVLYPELYTQ